MPCLEVHKAHANACMNTLIAATAVIDGGTKRYCPICNADRRSLMELEAVLVLDVLELRCVYCGGLLEGRHSEHGGII